MVSQLEFSCRKKYDSTEDSIWMNCFLTVARGNEETLEDVEQKHNFERARMEAACLMVTPTS
jgi:hypothetical protein